MTLYDKPHAHTTTTITSTEILRTTIEPFPEPPSVGPHPSQYEVTVPLQMRTRFKQTNKQTRK